MAVQSVFQRYEKKYILTSEQYGDWSKMISTRMTLDQYGKHTISNVYFDTDQFELIRTSLEKPVYKEKLRLRSYRTPKEDDLVFVELKKKYDGVVYKRRIPMKMKEARNYLYQGIYPEEDSQILREIDYMIKRYELHPAVFLAYDRMAWYGNENPELRVTFDTRIRCRSQELDLTYGDQGNLILDEDQVLMEIKIPGSVPIWMSQALSDLRIFTSSFSKYGTWYQQETAKQITAENHCKIKHKQEEMEHAWKYLVNRI